MNDRTVTNVRVAIKQLERIAERLPELRRRDAEQIGPDGYGNGGGDGRRSIGTHSDPTHSAALADKRRDEVHEWLTTAIEAVEAACIHANRAASHVYLIEQVVDQRTGHVNLVEQCPVCNDPMPQPRAGFCEPCYRRWARLGRPDRAPWVHQERQRLASREDGAA